MLWIEVSNDNEVRWWWSPAGGKSALEFSYALPTHSMLSFCYFMLCDLKWLICCPCLSVRLYICLIRLLTYLLNRWDFLRSIEKLPPARPITLEWKPLQRWVAYRPSIPFSCSTLIHVFYLVIDISVANFKHSSYFSSALKVFLSQYRMNERFA